MSAQLPEFVDQLIIDGTKVGWYPDRIAAWQRGEKIAPVTIDCAMTRACNYACDFCYAQLQANEADGKITREKFLAFLTDAAAIGVRGVSFISDGESTVVPWWADAVEHAAAVGLKVGAGSNGYKLTRPILERTLSKLSFLRFNFSAGEPKKYSSIMGVPPAWYHQVVQNIRDGMEIINRDGLGCTLNMQMVLNPKDGDQIIPFARLAAELKPTYAVIKHCADGSDGELGVDYGLYESLYPALQEAEAIGRYAGVRITAKWDRIKAKCSRTYSACYGPSFQLQVSGTGLVAPCGMMFNDKHKITHIGSIITTPFREIWASKRYDEVMGYLGSDQWDSRRRCPPGCLQNPTNEFLFAYKNGRISLPTAPPPPHLEFV
jgi:MoaA/NifB/PqqE/SkfB family radical SAM enzyme